MAQKKFSLIGYAYGDAATIPGAAEAPRVLRSLNLVERLRSFGLTVDDLGDAGGSLSVVDTAAIEAQASFEERAANNFVSTYAACKELAAKTTAALHGGSVPLIVGGDHSLSIGSVAAMSNFYRKRNEKIGLLWIDTHADINTPATSLSHNIYGMSVAFLLGLIPGIFAKVQHDSPAVEAENVAYIGLRDLDPGEKEIIRKQNILTFTMKEVDVLGIAEVIRRAIARVSDGTAGYVVSFDLDVCDPQLVPGTGTPVRGGLTFREAHLLLELLADDDKMLSFELVELNPRLDKDFLTADLAVSLIESALGKTIL